MSFDFSDIDTTMKAVLDIHREAWKDTSQWKTNMDLARYLLEKLRSEHPANTMVLTNLGAVLSDLGQHKTALLRLQKAAKLGSDDRDPKRIGLNMSKSIGGADGLTHSAYLELSEVLGKTYTGRFVSAEKLVSDFRSRRVASELAIYGEAGELSYTIAERAFSNEVITPGVTTLEDVAWWMKEQQFKNNLGSSFGMPSVHITGPDGVVATSTDRIIQRGDVLMIDWGVGLMNMFTDMKRMAYVLKEGETGVPPGIQNAFDQGVKVRDIIKKAIKPGVTAQQAEDAVYKALTAAGFNKMKGFNQYTDLDKTDVIIGCHSVGNWGHGIGPSIAFFNPVRLGYELKPSNLISIELFAYSKVPEWGGKKLRVPLEDDAVITERGIEWLYPVNPRVLLIK